MSWSLKNSHDLGHIKHSHSYGVLRIAQRTKKQIRIPVCKFGMSFLASLLENNSERTLARESTNGGQFDATCMKVA